MTAEQPPAGAGPHNPQSQDPPQRRAQPAPPVSGLAGRYRAAFAAAWRQRAQLAGPELLADEAAFLPAALSLQHTPLHPAPRRAAAVLVALCAAALLWSCLGQVDIVAVASGRIVVRERNKLVQPLERSVVRRILVQDGDRVRAGQALVELDPTSATADLASVQEQLRAAQSDVLRARALLVALQHADAQPERSVGAPWPARWTDDERRAALDQLAAEWGDITARLDRLAAESRRREAEVATAHAMVSKLEATLPLSRRREDDFKALAAQGFMAGHAGQDRTRERIELERDLLTQRARQQEALAALSESQNSHTAYRAETRRSLLERATQAAQRLQLASQELAKAARRERLTVLAASVDGTVQQLAAHTVGGVVTEAQALMVIVPDSPPGEPLVAEVMLENKDIGFVRAGQAAQVKLETLPFTRYGTVGATVQSISADAVPDEKRGAIFPARLLLGASHVNVDGTQVRVAPGMNVTAEIRTGRRRVIDFLLGPVQRAAQESLRER